MELYTISFPDVTPLKFVTAKATYGIGFLTAFVGGFCALFGIPNNMYREKIKKAEALAMQELEKNLKSIGADGVMDVRCQIDGLSFLITGTAYKWSAEERAKREAETKTKREAEEKAQREAEEKTRREAEAKTKREAEEKAQREAEEKTRREAEAIAKTEAEKRARQTTQKKEKTLSEELEYALKFQTDDGMVRYLKELQDETVQNILKSPQHLIREQIKNLLEHM